MVSIGPKISVVIPIYNAERTLNRCIDSLINQTFKDIEILLVNDGSVDGSEEICLAYVSKFPNIKYFKKTNGGVSSSRNTGIKEATGRYIAFCDSDDYYDDCAFERMYSLSNNGEMDMVVSGIRKLFLNRNEVECLKSGVYNEYTKDKVVYDLMITYSIHHMVGKLFRSSVIKSNNIYLDTQINVGEDLDWVCRFLTSVSNISVTEEILYNYCFETNDSLSQRFDPKSYTYLDKTYHSMKQLLESTNYHTCLQNLFTELQIQRVWGVMTLVARNDCNLNHSKKIKFLNECKKTQSYEYCVNSKILRCSVFRKTIYILRPTWLQLLVLQMVVNLKFQMNRIKNKVKKF